MKGSAGHSVHRRRDAFNASNGGRLRGQPLFFVAACPLGIKKPGHHTQLHAQMSLSIGSQSTSKRAAIPIPQTLPPASKEVLSHLTGGGQRLQPVFCIVCQASIALCRSIRRRVIGSGGRGGT